MAPSNHNEIRTPKTEFEHKRDFEFQRTWLSGIVSEAQNKKFYGKLTVIMEGGKIRRIIEERSLMTPETP